ncbi:DNA repair protein XRCC1 [Onthophagus taurus]|uniref:DNA repair protein XRCC1 n=1 Tax=Onthophagus taurus TaxID=166361 RepID=UPI0039BDFE4D
MPKINIETVVSFSTEDPVFPASNILNPDPTKKWKTHSQGEKSANIVLQLEKATQITSIDIGNEHSAYIEVLVSRSSSNDDYKVLLVMSSFMTPIEARQSSNTTKVRMFTYDQLSSPERDEKWDRIKIVCTQPFNRHVQYGLAFISLTSNEGKLDAVTPHIGKFLVRSESPTNLGAGSLFARRNEFEEKKTLTAAIREASVQAQKSPQMRNRDELLYEEDEIKKNSKIDALIAKRDQEKKEKEAREFIEKLEKESKMKKIKEEEERKKKIASPNTSKNSMKFKPTKRKAKKRSLPYQELLKGVVFTISGIQNPERGNLRSMALSIGAKYRPDWDNNCTHLICAFANTPKFNQVQGKGKIVTKDWIPDCYAQRKRLPWRRYALDRNDQNKPESEEEIGEEIDGESSDETNFNGSDTELENSQKKFKRNRVIVDSPSGTPSPVFEIDENELIPSNVNDNLENEGEKALIIKEALSVYDCDTDVDEDFCLKTTKD